MLKFKFFKTGRTDPVQSFGIGKRIHSKINGRICYIKNERILNSIKHFTLSIENEPTKRNILLSEQVVRSEYKVIEENG